MAAIQLKKGLSNSVQAEDIRDYCKQHLAPYAVPKYIEFKDELPLTVTEKVFKKVLRDEAVARMGVNTNKS